ECATRRDRPTVEFGVASNVAGHVWARRLEAEQLVDCAWNQARILDERAALIGIVGQHLARPADQLGGRFVSGAREDADVGEHLLSSEAARDSLLVLELDAEELRH